jgi:O-antigen/teichoic acid export membrane protein
MLGHALPPPDLLVVLDAPGDVLHGRKPEHLPERLERDRQGYLSLAHRVPGAIVVDASKPFEEVRRDVTDNVWRAYQRRFPEMNVSEKVQENPSTDGERVEAARQIRGSSLLLAGRVISLALNLIVQVLTVRVLSKEGYGVFAYALSIAALGEGLVGLGLPRAVARFLPIFDEQKDRARELGAIVLAFTSILAAGAAATLLVVGLRGTIAGHLASDPAAITALAILAVLAPLQGFDRLFLEFFSVFGNPRAIFLRRFLLGPALRLAAVLALMARGGGTVALAIGYVVAGAIGFVFYVTMLIKLLRERGILRPGAFAAMKIPAREMFAFALPLLSTEIVFIGIQQVDAIMLGQISGPLQVASLRAVVPIARLNQVVLEIFGILFTPMAARLFIRGDHSGVNRLYWRTTSWIAVLSFPLFAVTFMLAEPLASFLFGSEYADSGELLAILSLAYYVHAALGPNGLTLNVYKLIRYAVIVNFCVFALHVTSNLLLIPSFGAKGAAMATMTTLLVHNALKQIGLRKTQGVRAFDRSAGRPLLIAGAGVATIVLAELAWNPSLPAGVTLAFFVSLAVLFATRRDLDIEGTFPQLVRIPLLSQFFGAQRAS